MREMNQSTQVESTKVFRSASDFDKQVLTLESQGWKRAMETSDYVLLERPKYRLLTEQR